MTKLNVTGVVREFLDKHPGKAYTATELYNVCVKAGLQCEESKVFGSVQVMAAKRQCSRVAGKPRTFTSIVVAPVVEEVTVKAPLGTSSRRNEAVKAKRVKAAKTDTAGDTKPKRQSKAQTGYSDTEVINEITALIGEPKQGADRVALYFELRGTESGEYIVNRSKERLHKDTLVWYYKVVEGTTLVGVEV